MNCWTQFHDLNTRNYEVYCIIVKENVGKKAGSNWALPQDGAHQINIHIQATNDVMFLAMGC